MPAFVQSGTRGLIGHNGTPIVTDPLNTSIVYMLQREAELAGAALYRSTNGGASFGVVFSWSDGSRYDYDDAYNSGIHFDVNGLLHVVYGGWHKILQPSGADRTGLAVVGSTTAPAQGYFSTCAPGLNGQVVTVNAWRSGGGVALTPWFSSADGTTINVGGDVSEDPTGSGSVNGTMALEWNHGTDGRTRQAGESTTRLFLTYIKDNTGALWLSRYDVASGSLAFAGRQQVSLGTDVLTSCLATSPRWDPVNNRLLIAALRGVDGTGDSGAYDIFLVDCDAVGSNAVVRKPPAPPAGAYFSGLNGKLRAIEVTTDASGNAYLVLGMSNRYAGNFGARVALIKWTRATNTWGAWQTLWTASSLGINETDGQYKQHTIRIDPLTGATSRVRISATLGAYAGRLGPFLQFGELALNTPPGAAGKPTPEGVFDRAQAFTQTYQFNDVDTGDQPSKTDWRWRTSPVSGTPGSWNTVTVTGTSTSITWAANTFAAGRIEVQALPYDSAGAVAPAWSDSAFITAADTPTAPTFSSPASGSTIPTSSVTATISTPQLEALGWRVLGDTAGAADPTKVVNAGATIEDPLARQFTATNLANGQTVHLQARRRLNGLWSPWADNGAQPVNYTPPPAAVLTLTPLPATAKLSVAWTIPAPTGSQPTPTSVDLYVDDATIEGSRRLLGSVGLAPGASPWVHDTPVLGREYGAGTGRVRIVVKAANGTSTTTTS